MLLPADRVLGAMGEFQHLGNNIGDAGPGTLQQSLGVALKLLRTREHKGAYGVIEQLATLKQVLLPFTNSLAHVPALAHDLAILYARIDVLLDTPGTQDLESDWRDVLSQTEKCVHTVGQNPRAPVELRATMTRTMTAWEISDLQSQLASDSSATEQAVELDSTSLQVYLQQRFNDLTLKVNRLHPLAGGFGKQTFLFDVEGRRSKVEGRELNGSFVM